MEARMVYPTAPVDTEASDAPTAQTGAAENVDSPGKAKTLLSKVKQKAKKLKNTMKKVTGTSATSTERGEAMGNHEKDGNDMQLGPNGNDEDDGTESNEVEDEEDDVRRLNDNKLTYEELRSIGALDKEGDGSEAEVHAGVPVSTMSDSPDTYWKGADDSTPIGPYKSAGPSNALQASPTEYHNYAANVDPLLESEKTLASKPDGLAEDVSEGMEKENSPLGSASSPEAKRSSTISPHEAEKPQNRHDLSEMASDIVVPQPKPDTAFGSSSPTHDDMNLMNEVVPPDSEQEVLPSEEYNESVKQNLSDMSVPAVGRSSSPSKEYNGSGEQNPSEMLVPESSPVGVTSSRSYSQSPDPERESSERSVSEIQVSEVKPEEVNSISSYSQSADPGNESGRPDVAAISVSNPKSENSSHSEIADLERKSDEQNCSEMEVPEPKPGELNVNSSNSLSADSGSVSGRPNLGETAVPESKAGVISSRSYSQPRDWESDSGKRSLSEVPVAESKPGVNLNSAYSKTEDPVFSEQPISNTGLAFGADISNPDSKAEGVISSKSYSHPRDPESDGGKQSLSEVPVAESKPEVNLNSSYSKPENSVYSEQFISNTGSASGADISNPAVSESKPEGAFGRDLSNPESLVEPKPSSVNSSVPSHDKVAVMDEDLSADRKLGVGRPSPKEHVGSGDGNSLDSSLPKSMPEGNLSRYEPAVVKHAALDTASASDVDVSYPEDLIKPNPSFGKLSSPTHDKIAVMNEDLPSDRKLDVGLSSEEHFEGGKRSLLESSVPELEELSGYQHSPSVRPESDKLVYRPVSEPEVASHASPGTTQCQDVSEKALDSPEFVVNNVTSKGVNDVSLAGASSCHEQKGISDSSSEQPADEQIATAGDTDREVWGKFAADKSSTVEDATAGGLVGSDHRDENENREMLTGGWTDKVNTTVNDADNTDQGPNLQDDVVAKAHVDDDVKKEDEEEYYDPNEVHDDQFQEGFRRGSIEEEALSGTLAGSAIEKLQGLKETMRSSFRYSTDDSGARGEEEPSLEGERPSSPARHQQEKGGFVQGLRETIASSLGYGKSASPSHENADNNDVSGRAEQSESDSAKMQQHSAETTYQDGREEELSTPRGEDVAGDQSESDLAKMQQHSAETSSQDRREEELPTPRGEGEAGEQSESDLAKMQQHSAETTYQDGREEESATARGEGEAGHQSESDLATMQQHSAETTHQDGREEELPTPRGEGEARDQSESDLAMMQHCSDEITHQDGREEEFPTPRDEGEAGEQHSHVKPEHDGIDVDDTNRQHEVSSQQRSGGLLQGVKDMVTSKFGFNSNQPQETSRDVAQATE